MFFADELKKQISIWQYRAEYGLYSAERKECRIKVDELKEQLRVHEVRNSGQ